MSQEGVEKRINVCSQRMDSKKQSLEVKDRLPERKKGVFLFSLESRKTFGYI